MPVHGPLTRFHSTIPSFERAADNMRHGLRIQWPDISSRPTLREVPFKELIRR